MDQFWNKLVKLFTAYHNQIQQTERFSRMLSNDYITFQKSLLNKKCEEQDSHINPFANLIFNSEWKSFPQSFTLGSPTKNKCVQTTVSLKNEVLNWFKSLSYQEKIDVITLRDRNFIYQFLRYSGRQYECRQVNFKSGYSIANLLETPKQKLKFNEIKQKINIALTGQPMLFINFQLHSTVQRIVEWLEEVTNNKIFQYANKIINKDQPQENLLWFSSCSFHTLQEWLANQLEKTIIKHYFKRDLLPNYRLKQFTEYMLNKHPAEGKLLKLTIQQARKLTKQEIQINCSAIKNYENSYYQNVRQNFIQSLQILENDKGTKKKKKNKRRGKKKTSCSPHTHMGNQVMSPHKKINCLSENQKDSESQQIEALVPEIICQEEKVQQSTGQFLVQDYQSQSHQFQKENKSEKQNDKKCICKQQTTSQITSNKRFERSVQRSSGINNKNLVMNRQRSMSPFTKSNTLDNDCSKSMLSGEVFQTFTQAITQQCLTKAEQFQLQNYQSQMNQKNGQQVSQNNNQSKVSKKRKRKANTSNKYIDEMVSIGSKGLINKQLTNFIDSLSIETNNLYESKVICFERIRYFIKNLFPQTQAMLFGSNSMGLSLPSSDVDIMLYNVPCRSKQQIKQMLAQIAIEINAMGWIVSCSTYLNAKAPLVKLQIDPLISYFQTKRRCDYQTAYDPMILYYLDVKDRKKAKNIYVDLTINLEDKDTGISPSTQLMRTLVNQDPVLQRIILVFKYILAEKGYNKNFGGGLGSYCLFIMIAAYFRQFKTNLPEDEGQIFLDILKFYSQEFENKLKSITLRDEGSCFISLQESLSIANLSEAILSNPLRIIDPLTLNLMSSSCAQYHQIKCEFRRIRNEIMVEFESMQKQISSNYSGVQLSKLIGNQKGVQKWINKYQSRKRFSIKKIIDGKVQNQ